MSKCGSNAGWWRHYRAGEEACLPCKDAHRAYRREYARKLRKPHPTRTVMPCGTRAAYARHLRHGEKPCMECREANRAYIARRTAK